MNSILEERFSLHDLLDVGVMREICEAYAKAFGLGVRVLGDQGEEYLAINNNSSFCQAVAKSKQGARCADVERRLVRHPLEGSQVLQLRTHCGMKYALIPLTYQLEPLGRAVVGPFRDPTLTPDAILAMAGDGSGLATVKDVEAVPAMPPEQLKLAVSLLTKIMNAFLFINAKRLITTRLHLENIYSSREQIFRQVELQDSGTKEDKEEIEKLKNMF